SGTSQAAAITSGAVALLLQSRPDLTPDQVKALLTSTDRNAHVPSLKDVGVIDVHHALTAPVPPHATQSFDPAVGTGSLEAARRGPTAGSSTAPAGRAAAGPTPGGKAAAGPARRGPAAAGPVTTFPAIPGTGPAGPDPAGPAAVGRAPAGRAAVGLMPAGPA